MKYLMAVIALLMVGLVSRADEELNILTARLEAQNAAWAKKSDCICPNCTCTTTAHCIDPGCPKATACGCVDASDCQCGNGCSCPNCLAKPKKPRPAGEGWQWEPSEGGYWWRWKSAPPQTFVTPRMFYPAPVALGRSGCST